MAAPSVTTPMPEPRARRTLPDVAICRAKRSDFLDYVECLVDVRDKCRFRFPFQSTQLCIHMTREDILARTKA
jgi:hypothetical protein